MGKNYLVPSLRLASDSESISLPDALASFLSHSGQPVLLIRGAAGIGKTACLHYIKTYAAEKNIAATLLSLQSYSAAEMRPGSKSFIKSMLKKLGWEKKAKQLRLLLLDGQDALQQKIGLSNFYYANHLHRWKKLKVVFTYRQELLPSFYQHYFAPTKGELIEWQLLPFNKTQQLQYAQNFMSKHVEHHYSLTVNVWQQFLQQLPCELAGNPLLLRFSLIGFKRIEKSLQSDFMAPKTLSRYEIFTAAIEKYFAYEEQKCKKNKRLDDDGLVQARFLFAQDIALRMWANQSKIFSIANWNSKLFPQFTQSLALKTEAEKQQILLSQPYHCLTMRQDEVCNSVYHFKHASVQEYLVACWLLNHLKNAADFNQLSQFLNDYKITPTLLLSDQGVINFLLEEINKPEERLIKVTLNKIILATRQNQGLSQLGALAMTLLNSAGENFNYRDYRGISIPGAILRNSRFYGAILQGSNLSRVNFQGADLTLANLQNCFMSEIHFGEYLQAKIEEGNCYQFSPDLKQILVGHENGELKIFNFSNDLILEGFFKPDVDRSAVKQLSWHTHEQLIISQHVNNKAYLIEQKKKLILPIPLSGRKEIVSLVLTVNNKKKIICIAYKDGFINLFRYKKEHFESLLYKPLLVKEVRTIALSKDNDILVNNKNGQIDLYSHRYLENKWQLNQQIKSLTTSFTPLQLQFSPDSKTFIYCLNEVVMLWDTESGKLINTFCESSSSEKTSLCYHHDSIIAGDTKGNLYLWHLNAPEPIFQIKAQSEKIVVIEFIIESKLIACMGERGTITRHHFNLASYHQKIQKIYVSPNGNYCLSISCEQILVLQTDCWQILMTHEISNISISCAAINNEGNIIVVGGKSLLVKENFQDIVTIFIQGKNYCLPHDNLITTILITPDEQFLFFGDSAGTLKLWDFRQEKIVWTQSLMPFKIANLSYSIKTEQVIAVFPELEKLRLTVLSLKVINGEITDRYIADYQIAPILNRYSSNFIVTQDAMLYLHLLNYKHNTKKLLSLNMREYGQLIDICPNQRGTIIIGVDDSYIYIWQRLEENIYLKEKIIHPDSPMQVFLFESPEYLKILTKSKNNLRLWVSANYEPYQFKLMSKIGHSYTSLVNAKIDGVKKISIDDLKLFHQLGAHGYPVITGHSPATLKLSKPPFSDFFNKLFFPNTWPIIFSTNEEAYQLSCSLQFNAVKIKLLQKQNAYQQDVNAVLANALTKSFKLVKAVDYLDLSDNGLDDRSMNFLASALQNLPGFEKMPLFKCKVLVLSNNYVGKEGLKTLLEAIAKKPSIKQILLNHNYIDCNYNFLKNIITPCLEKAGVVHLDLMLNFIPKGDLLEIDNKRPYHEPNKLAHKLNNPSYRIHNKVTFFTPMLQVSSYDEERKASVEYSQTQATSLITSFDVHNDTKIININHGIIGLMLRKNPSLTRELVYLVIEGISKFGQRYILRGDLFAAHDGTIKVNLSHCTPQEFLNFTNCGKDVFFKSLLASRVEIKRVIKKIIDYHDKQSSFNSHLGSTNKNNYNCLSWAIKLLEEAGVEKEVRSWLPPCEVTQEAGCQIN